MNQFEFNPDSFDTSSSFDHPIQSELVQEEQ